MTKQGTKPSAGKSSATTPRLAVKSAATHLLAVRDSARPAPRPAPKVVQSALRKPAPPLPTPKRTTPWTIDAASRVYRTTALENGGQVKELYGMNETPRYRFWFWIALVLDASGPDFRQETAACLGRGFDLDSARAPFIELSNSCITGTGTPEAFLVLDKLLCRQSTTRAAGDREMAMAALDELRMFVSESDGVAAFHIHAMEARITSHRNCFSQEPLCPWSQHPGNLLVFDGVRRNTRPRCRRTAVSVAVLPTSGISAAAAQNKTM